MALWGYSELSRLLNKHAGIKTGVILDTNILVSATYEPDRFHDDAIDVVDRLIENKIPLFCNINVRIEFLEIHRRILFSEEILDFEAIADKSKLPASLASMLTTYRNKYERKLKAKPDEAPLRLSDPEIKGFKFEMLQVKSEKGNLWTELCENKISSKILDIWNETEQEVGVNFLGLGSIDHKSYLIKNPEWNDAVNLMSKHGLASSDAMILNMYLCSIFETIVSSDSDIAIAIKNENHSNKHCLLPDDTKTKLEAI